MRVLSLFSGGGLGDYGLELAGMEIVGQVEIDDYCQKILKLRWPNVPKWKDIRKFKGKEGQADVVAGGFPCQPFSVAGRKRGKDDNRNLWPEMRRVIAEVKPTWVFAENVRGIVKPYLDTVLADLEGLGYSRLPLLIPASAVNAPHRRERLWIVAHTTGLSARNQEQGFDNQQEYNPEERFGATQGNRSSGPGRWATEPNVGRVAHGVPNRVDRLKLLGNGQVVQVVQWIGERIMDFDKAHKPTGGGE